MTNPFAAAIAALEGEESALYQPGLYEDAIRVLEAAGNNPLDVAELLKAVLNGRGEKIDPPKDCAYAALPDEVKE